MKITLSDELRRVIGQSEVPIEVQDEQTGASYYVISVPQYKQLLELMHLEQVDPSLFEFSDVRNAE